MDRYLYSALVRDVSRGVGEQFVRNIYAFAPTPDLLIYLDVSPHVALERKRALGFYESGEDILARDGAAQTRADYFLEFQAHCRTRYQTCLPADTLWLDASRAEDVVRADVVAVLRRTVPDLAVR
jgi:dTMP kinase